MYFTIDSFLWFVDRLGIFPFQPGMLGAVWFLVLVVHINDTEDEVVTIGNTILDFLF